jgi:hypothetical protein
MIAFCCDPKRRALVRVSPVNGIDRVEVDDLLVDDGAQRLLWVFFVKQPSDALKALITRRTVLIDGGERITGIRVASVSFERRHATDVAEALRVEVQSPGDFSEYTLRIASGETPLTGMDPILSEAPLRFKARCDTGFDCLPVCACDESIAETPTIDYLAKDYDSFRLAILERLSLLLPGWTETSPADPLITLVEALAYVADHHSQTQDAVLTESFLPTARLRRSIRRHARLVDYPMHDGCNARAWVRVILRAGTTGSLGPAIDSTPLGSQILGLLTASPGLPTITGEDDARAIDAALAAGALQFEPMHSIEAFAAHNEMHFHTWGDTRCCLPTGATSAALVGNLTTLAPGMILVLAEVKGPKTGSTADADPTRRHAVRITRISFIKDEAPPLPDGFVDGDPLPDPIDVTLVSWRPDDALPLELCISSEIDEDHGGGLATDVSVAWGNILLADHGRTVTEELDPVPTPLIVGPAGGDACACHDDDEVDGQWPWPTFQPTLEETPLTFAAPLPAAAFDDPGGSDLPASAAALMVSDARAALPSIVLTDTDSDEQWRSQRDLLSSSSSAREFVVETDHAGGATLRFGDGELGMAPAEGTEWIATYRVGNGTAGNVGAGAIIHAVTDSAIIESVTNPLPAISGTDPESAERVRALAPASIRVPMRAVTPEDYALAAQLFPGVQRAAATVRWTGSWSTIFLTVDRADALPVDAAFERDLRDFLERRRLAGHDLEVDAPRYVSLEIAARVCVDAAYHRSEVARALFEVLSTGQTSRTRGFFHPDNFTFGQPVLLSTLYAAAQGVAGVRAVQFTTFQRLGLASSSGLDAGKLPMARLEIARLDNDPNYPERGTLTLHMEGGR